MKKYIKNTFLNGYENHVFGENVEVSAEDMVANFAHLHYLKQSGEDITLDRKLDENYEVTQYIVTRKLSDKTIIHTYDIVEC